MDTVSIEPRYRNSVINKINSSDKEIHDWYRFVLSYPPHIVRKYIKEFNLNSEDILLDPFCGTGTTIVEAKLNNIPSIGIEANGFAHFASSVKTSWDVDVDQMKCYVDKIKNSANKEISKVDVDTSGKQVLKSLKPDQEKIILKNSISAIPLHKSIILLEEIEKYKHTKFYIYFKLAYGTALVYKNSNLRFGPEVGIGKIKTDADVVNNWYQQITNICNDLKILGKHNYPSAEVILSDARDIKRVLNGRKVTAVITSPPYPNEKDYTRTTRLESVLLGFINNREELRSMKKTLLRSNTKGVYKDDSDDQFVADFSEIQNIAEEIESKRIELGKTSGFEKLYAKVTKLYFGGIARHLKELRGVLAPNAYLAYVVGDQASFLRVMIPTGKILADIAQSLGYELIRIDLFRTRFSTTTKSVLNEEVVILKWNGFNQ
ncbi:site-specific DNA-methyltransferase [Mucilaginibacter roseus]|uniref:site-specific DNA-methyltransferase (cytosine-N(4)-specific) n=1 Tax=Mucilaginibacter roseus TaxID=1528868 RepID=A0ABS8U543_9SPHI|nr:DNA methyltransferase [Mucilaginibacter roseus]MCD8742243.1 site-specific DNA-methyltransferase [Mucilaginibacter roseus]